MSDRRVSVVLGGARGIGAATARALAARGSHVVVVDRASDDPRLPYALASAADLDAALDAARRVKAQDVTVTGVVADVTDEDAMREVVAGVEDRHGRIDAVVVCAGVVAGGVPVWEMPREQVDAVLDVNLAGVVTAARVGIPALLRTRAVPCEGRFIAVASIAGTRGLPMLASYCAAKAGVLGFVRALAAELRGSGITANTVSPGSTDTLILTESARLYALPGAEAFATQQPIGRLINPMEVATVIAWLAGPDSGAITGADHTVDGGLSL